MFGFEVRWPKPNLAYSWMVKNRLFPSCAALAPSEELFPEVLLIIIAVAATISYPQREHLIPVFTSPPSDSFPSPASPTST
jgi:hypothetical protein